MEKEGNKETNDSVWNDEAKAAFNAFKKRRRTLPSPSDMSDVNGNSSKKIRRPNDPTPSRLYNRKGTLNSNRNLYQEFSANDDQMKNSTMADNFVSMDVSESELNQTEVACDEFERKLATVRTMIHEKDDVHKILDKIVDELADSYKNCKEMIHKSNNENIVRCQRLNHQYVELENEMSKKINHIRHVNEERTTALEISQKCSIEKNILWISFADPNEIEQLRQKSRADLFLEARKLFKRMNIWLNDPARSIVDVFIQKVALRTEIGFENELIMGVKFLSSVAVQDLKRLIMKHAKDHFISKDFDAIRYTVRDNWSADIWKLLRVCYDLSNCKLVERVNVSEIGIIASYKSMEEQNGQHYEKWHKALIRNESDLNDLRKTVGDVACEIPTFQFYCGDYFKLSTKDRMQYKSKHNPATSTNVNNDENKTNNDQK